MCVWWTMLLQAAARTKLVMLGRQCGAHVDLLSAAGTHVSSAPNTCDTTTEMMWHVFPPTPAPACPFTTTCPCRLVADGMDALKAGCNAGCSCCAGLRQQLLHSPYHLPATSIVLLVAVYGTLTKKDADAWWEAATGGSSSSSSSSQQDKQQGQQQGVQDQQLQARWKKAAWALACSRHAALPISHQMLLQLANCSSKALLWAATHDYNFADDDLTTVSNLYLCDARRHLVSAVERDYSSPSLVPDTSAVFLRPAVLLHWAWHYLQENPGALMEKPRFRVLQVLVGSPFTFSVVASRRALACSNERLQQLEQQKQKQQQQQPPQESRDASGGDMKSEADKRSGLFFPVPVYLQILDDVLLLVHKLLALVLPLAAGGEQAAQAASSSSSDRAASSSSSHAEQEQNRRFDALLKESFHGLLALYTDLSCSSMTEYAGMQRTEKRSTPRAALMLCSEVPPLREDAAVWFQHAAQMCRVLEAYVRAAARSQAAGGQTPLLEQAVQLGAALVELLDPTESGLHGPLLQAAAAAGPGSKEQQALHGLLRSMLKWAAVMGPQQQRLAEQLRAAVAVAAANMLLAANRSQDPALAPVEGEAAAAGGGPSSSAAAADGSSHHAGSSSEQQPTQHSVGAQVCVPPASLESAAVAAVLPHLPWLGVLGCCCLQWSLQLGSLPNSSAAAAEAADQSMLPHRATGVISVLPRDLCSVWGTTMEVLQDGEPLALLCMRSVRTWIASLNSKHSMADTGESARMLVLALADASPVVNSFVAVNECYRSWLAVRNAAEEGPDDPLPLAGYAQQLSVVGGTLCSVAHKQSCNNPACSNLSGPSELQLVKGRSSTCSGCRTARYCSSQCMRQHWKQHRPLCKAVEKMAAAATAAAADPDAAASGP